MRFKLLCTVFALVMLAAGCATAPPQRPDNLCAIFQEKGSWYKAARKARQKWGLPVPLGMAFIHRESSFRSDARPKRQRLLGIVPWRRPSNALAIGLRAPTALVTLPSRTMHWRLDWASRASSTH